MKETDTVGFSQMDWRTSLFTQLSEKQLWGPGGRLSSHAQRGPASSLEQGVPFTVVLVLTFCHVHTFIHIITRS